MSAQRQQPSNRGTETKRLNTGTENKNKVVYFISFPSDLRCNKQKEQRCQVVARWIGFRAWAVLLAGGVFIWPQPAGLSGLCVLRQQGAQHQIDLEEMRTRERRRSSRLMGERWGWIGIGKNGWTRYSFSIKEAASDAYCLATRKGLSGWVAEEPRISAKENFRLPPRAKFLWEEEWKKEQGGKRYSSGKWDPNLMEVARRLPWCSTRVRVRVPADTSRAPPSCCGVFVYSWFFRNYKWLIS